MAFTGKRDPGIAELVAYFDAIPAPKRSLEYLKTSEIDLIREEYRRCQAQFEYAARNYFWITTKFGEDLPFFLWEGQVLVLEKYYELREKFTARGLNKAVKLMILKARQLGCSTLIEAMLAWKMMFFPNENCLVVSDTNTKAEALFGIMLHVYDMLPWWLKPMQDKMSYKLGMHLQNPSPDERQVNPGLNSRVWVAAATQEGVGQGFRLSGVHVSEYASFSQKRAKEIIEGDMANAIAETPASFAFLESTGKGAGTYAHRLWRGMSDLLNQGREPNWYPLFLPAFFERTRVLAPPQGWHPEPAEVSISKRASREWVRCNKCLKYAQQWFNGESRIGLQCAECQAGAMRALELTEDQLYWFEDRRVNAEQSGVESLKELKQEQCVTAEEAFQLSGIEIFPYACLSWVDETVIDPPPKRGFLDSHGKFHGRKGDRGTGCWMEGCEVNHEADETPLHIWEDPIPGEQYSIGADVAEGLGGNADYSVAFVNRVGRGANPDCQVAVFRSNTIDPIEFAAVLNELGLMYNEALMCIEYNFMDTCANTVRWTHLYPNLYRWKHLDAVTNVLSSKYHWYTQPNTRPRLHQTAKRWLKGRSWVIRSANFRAEMTTFQADEDDERGKAKAAKGFHDDEVMSGFISLYCAHEGEWNENLNYIPLPNQVRSPKECAFTMECGRCGHQWGEQNPEQVQSLNDAGNPCCPNCHSIIFRGAANSRESLAVKGRWEDLMLEEPLEISELMPYDRL